MRNGSTTAGVQGLARAARLHVPEQTLVQGVP